MMLALKPEIAERLSESARKELLAALNTLTQSRLESVPWQATLTVKHYLCDLVPAPPEPGDVEPL